MHRLLLFDHERSARSSALERLGIEFRNKNSTCYSLSEYQNGVDLNAQNNGWTGLPIPGNRLLDGRGTLHPEFLDEIGLSRVAPYGNRYVPSEKELLVELNEETGMVVRIKAIL